MARPSRFTSETRERILNALRVGSTERDAARSAAVAESTFHRWMSDRRPEFRNFQEEVELVKAAVVVMVVANLHAQTRRNTRACLLWLRRYGGPEWRLRCPNCGQPFDFEGRP